MPRLDDDTARPPRLFDGMHSVTVEDGAEPSEDGEGPAGPFREGPGQLNHYVLLAKLGQGGMGVVYAAWDQKLDRKVAIKLLRSDGDPRGQRRLEREAQALAKLSHPNVVQIYEIGAAEGLLFLVMEFVEGVTLRDWLAADPPPSRAAILSLFIDAGRGLAAAHREGLVHRDFKPDNVMIREDGRVLVMDFGLARTPRRRAGEESEEGEDTLGEALPATEPSGLTATGVLRGTPAYMAPEQFEGRTVDARSDQFAFCIALWEALHGRRPFTGDTLVDLSDAVCKGRVDTRNSKPEVPGWLREILLRGLAVDPQARWPTMLELLEALRKDPTQFRRALVVGGGLVAVAVAAVLALQLGHTRREHEAVAACEREAQAIDGDWSEEAQAELGARFDASGFGFAPSAWTHTRRWMDAYAEGWSLARREACVEARVERSRDEASYARIAACLDERRARFAGLLRAWDELDEVSITQATRSAASLPPLSSCSDADRLALRTQAPEELRAEVEELRGELEQLKALSFAGKYEAGLARTQALAERAEALGWRPLEAEIAVDLGEFQVALADYEGGLATLEQAYLDAVGGHDELAALQAATALASLEGRHRSNKERGLYWAELARMHVVALGLEGTIHEARALASRAGTLQEHGELAESRALHERVLELTEAALGPEHIETAGALTNLGTLRWDLAEHDEAIAAFREGLRIREAVLGPAHPDIGMSHNNIGAVLWSQGEYEEALAAHERARSIRELALGPDHPDVGMSYNNIGAVLAGLGRNEDALAAFQKALEIERASSGPKHPNVGGALTNIGNMKRTLGDYEGALADHEAALALWQEALGPEHPYVAMALNNIGVLQSKRGEHEQAIATHERALEIRERALGEEHPSVAMSLDNLANVYSARGDQERALELYRRGLAILEQAHGDDHVDVADTLNNIGAVQGELGQHELALAAHRRAFAIHEAELGPDHPDLAYSLAGIAEAQAARGELAKAEGALERALELREAEEADSPELPAVRFALAKVLWQRGDKRERAKLLAEQARVETRALAENEDLGELLAEIDAWLAAR